MEFFIDTGIIEEIQEAYQWGIVDGVTTNPSLIAKSGRDQRSVIEDICQIVDGPISAEVISTVQEEMIQEAKSLAQIHKNIVVKLPLTRAGIAACKVLSDMEIKTNVTLCFSANQALLAAKAGASYISPFIGRLDDIGQSGISLIEDIRDIYDNFDFSTKILAASIRHSDHVKMVALAGAHVATIPFKVMNGLFNHPLTDKGLATFLEDHRKANL
jgi:transaldolase